MGELGGLKEGCLTLEVTVNLKTAIAKPLSDEKSPRKHELQEPT